MSISARRLGIDPGSRRIGLALSEPDVGVAFPYLTIEHEGLRKTANRIAEHVDATGAEEVVVGLPLRLDGSEGEAAAQARQLAGMISELTKARVILWDERLSTVAVQRARSQAGISERRGRPTIDQSAAVLILQSYIDAQTKNRWEDQPSPDFSYLRPSRQDRRRSARSKKRRGR